MVLLRFALFTFIFGATTAYADFFLHDWKNQHRPEGSLFLAPQFTFYTTNVNYDSSGSRVAPAGLLNYTRLQSDVLFAASLMKRWTLYARASWSWVSVNHETSSRNNSVFGFTDQTVGTSFLVFETPTGLTLSTQVQVDLPLYSNLASSSTASNLFLGDGTTDITGGLFVAFPIDSKQNRHWVVEGGGGFTWRTSGFSYAVPWNVRIRHDLHEKGRFFFDLGTGGIFSLGTDTSTSTGGFGAEGSYFINAVNPTFFDARGEFGYRFTEKLSTQIFAAKTLLGRSAPDSFRAGISLGFELGSPPVWGKPERLSPAEYGHSNQGFVNYTFQANVTRVNDRLNLIRIDKGKLDGVKPGQFFDIFSINKDGTVGEAVARSKVDTVRDHEAVIKVTEYFKEVWIEEGFVVKRPIE